MWKSRVRESEFVLNFDYIGLEIFKILRGNKAFSISESLGYIIGRCYNSLFGGIVFYYFY